MDTVNVALVRSDSRRGAVAEALGLIAADLRAAVAMRTLVKPNLVCHRRQLSSTHPDTLSAALDAILAAGAREVVVAVEETDTAAGFDRFGYRRECWCRPVRFFDINRDEAEWAPLQLVGAECWCRPARVSRTVVEAQCRVSLALAQTHATARVALGLGNMLSCLHPDDRVLLHGHTPGGNGFAGWKGAVVEFLESDNLLVNVLTRVRGRVRNVAAQLRGKQRPDAWERLSPSELAFLRSVEAMNRNLVALARAAGPHVSVIDGFVGMHREGPQHGSPIRLGTVIAGTDPVAVDAVAAAVMGFDPRTIGYLVLAEAFGLGVADLERIAVLGDPIAAVRRRCVPHSNDAVSCHWNRLPELTGRRPHIRATTPPHRRISSP